MNTIEKFLTHLHTLDVKLWLEDEKLRCSAPDEILTPEFTAELQTRKPEIIAFLQQVNLVNQKVTSIPTTLRTDKIPLSFAQQRLWFFQQLNPDNSAYNNFSALRLVGEINIALLEKAFTEIVRRHESLRTTFTTNSEGLPIQVIAPSQPFKISIVDLKDVPNRYEELERLATKEAEKPFDLTQPLLRINLLKLAETKYVLLLTMHHIISDRWSLGIFVRVMKVLYEAFLNKQNPVQTPLSELPIQYADWAVWQQQYLQGKVLQVQTDYWKKQLKNLPVLKLPTDRPRPAIATYKGVKQP